MDDEIILQLPLARDDWEALSAMIADWRARRKSMPPERSQSIWVPAPIYVTNDSGEEIPAFGCMQATGTEERSGQNFVIVDKPADSTGAAGPFLFNGPEPIEIDGDGLAQNGSVLRMLTDGTSFIAGQRVAPQASSWEVTDGSLFPFVGNDDIATDVIKAMYSGTSGLQIFIYEVTTVYSAGSCLATITTLAAVVVETGATVIDPINSFANVLVGAKGFCLQSGDSYYALGPYVTTVDWTSPTLSYTKGGGGNINIDTAENC